MSNTPVITGDDSYEDEEGSFLPNLYTSMKRDDMSEMQLCNVLAVNCGYQLQFDRVGDVSRKKQSMHRATLRRFIDPTLGLEISFYDRDWQCLMNRINLFLNEGEIQL